METVLLLMGSCKWLYDGSITNKPIHRLHLILWAMLIGARRKIIDMGFISTNYLEKEGNETVPEWPPKTRFITYCHIMIPTLLR